MTSFLRSFKKNDVTRSVLEMMSSRKSVRNMILSLFSQFTEEIVCTEGATHPYDRSMKHHTACQPLADLHRKTYMKKMFHVLRLEKLEIFKFRSSCVRPSSLRDIKTAALPISPSSRIDICTQVSGKLRAVFRMSTTIQPSTTPY